MRTLIVMMKRSPAYWILAAAAAASFAQPANAQRIDSPYRFLDHGQFGSVWAGHAWPADGRIGNGPEPAPIFGIAWALRVSGPFALNVEAGYMPTTRTVRDTVFNETESMFESLGEADFSLLTAMANLRLNLTGSRTWNSLQPFVVAGAGVAVDVASGSSIEADLPPNARFNYGTSFAGQLGAGVDWFLSPRVSIRLDARDLFWKLPVPEAFLLTENGAALSRSEWEQNFTLAAGLSIHF
jgi:opacity protein-like surface antigen